MYDLIIKNGMIIDGTGSPSFHADIAIQNGKIARIGRNLTIDRLRKSRPKKNRSRKNRPPKCRRSPSAPRCPPRR